MNVGTGQKNSKGHLEFVISFPLMAEFRLILKANPEAGRTDKNYPAFHCHIGRQQCGAVWKKTSKGGVDYLQGHIKSPAFAAGMASLTIFKSQEESRRGEMDVLWEPPRPETRRESAPPHSGQASPPDAGDDDIPF